MSSKMRGQEITIRIAVDGVVKTGSFVKCTDFTATPRTELNEDDYIGEDETDIDIQHHGWDGGFTIDYLDEEAIELTEQIIAAEADHEAHPKITITAIYTFREPGARGKIVVYYGVYMKQDEEGIGGRKEKVKGKFSFKCKKRRVLNA